MYFSGSYKRTALKLFYEYTQHIHPEIIKDKEAIWINKATQSALFYSVDNYNGPGYKYDINSQYPYIMAYSSLKFPVKKGKFMKISCFNDIENPLYGI